MPWTYRVTCFYETTAGAPWYSWVEWTDEATAVQLLDDVLDVAARQQDKLWRLASVEVARLETVANDELPISELSELWQHAEGALGD